MNKSKPHWATTFSNNILPNNFLSPRNTNHTTQCTVTVDHECTDSQVKQKQGILHSQVTRNKILQSTAIHLPSPRTKLVTLCSMSSWKQMWARSRESACPEEHCYLWCWTAMHTPSAPVFWMVHIHTWIQKRSHPTRHCCMPLIREAGTFFKKKKLDNLIDQLPSPTVGKSNKEGNRR